MKTRFSHQCGFAAVAAVFLVVVLAALGAFMVSISNSQQLSSAADIRGTRAFWAARTGIEWGLTGLTATSSCPASSFTVNSFTVVVTCTKQNFPEGGSTVAIFELKSVASVGSIGGLGFIERSVSASVER